MRLKAALASVLIFFCAFVSAQSVDDVGTGWKSKVDSALMLIDSAGPEFSDEVKRNCKRVTYWIGDFSTSVDTSVVIAVHDMKLGSVANLACAIIHEAHHMELRRLGVKMPECEEEIECYTRECRFLDEICCEEAWLVVFVYRSISKYQEDCK